MDYLKQFEKDFWANLIPIRQQYNSGKIKDKNNANADNDNENNENDVVYDLNTRRKPVSSTCLPIAKQIATADQKLSFKLPRLGDLFIGLLHQSIINKVSFTIHNYKEDITVDGVLKKFDDQLIWVFTELPIPLICLTDYDSMYLDINIYLNNNYNLQAANQEVFKAYYGYLNQSIQYQAIQNTVYNINIYDNHSQLKIICGMWTIDSNL